MGLGVGVILSPKSAASWARFENAARRADAQFTSQVDIWSAIDAAEATGVALAVRQAAQRLHSTAREVFAMTVGESPRPTNNMSTLPPSPPEVLTGVMAAMATLAQLERSFQDGQFFGGPHLDVAIKTCVKLQEELPREAAERAHSLYR